MPSHMSSDRSTQMSQPLPSSSPPKYYQRAHHLQSQNQATDSCPTHRFARRHDQYRSAASHSRRPLRRHIPLRRQRRAIIPSIVHLRRRLLLLILRRGRLLRNHNHSSSDHSGGLLCIVRRRLNVSGLHGSIIPARGLPPRARVSLLAAGDLGVGPGTGVSCWTTAATIVSALRHDGNRARVWNVLSGCADAIASRRVTGGTHGLYCGGTLLLGVGDLDGAGEVVRLLCLREALDRDD